MIADAIGRRVEITVWRNGALVDVIAVPRDCRALSGDATRTGGGGR